MRYLIIFFFILISCNTKEAETATDEEPVQAEDSLSMYKTDKSVEQVVEDLIAILRNKEFTIFNRIDHAENAEVVNMNLPPNTVIIFGKPEVGTSLMQCDRRMGIELPLKILIFKGTDGATHVGYWNMGEYAEYYELDACEELLTRINNTLQDVVTEALERTDPI